MSSPFLILFYKKSGIVDNLIRWITHGKYSHCALIFPDRLHSLELSYKNPTVIKHFNYSKKSYDMYRLNIDLSQEDIYKINDFIIRKIESGYDFKYLLSRGCNLLFGTKIVNSKNKYTCDEMIVESFKQIGINLVDDNVFLSPDSLSQSKYLRKI